MRYLLVLVVLLVLASAGPDALEASDRERADYFESKVRPLLAQRCFRCHGPKQQRGGLRLDRGSRVLAGGDSGPVLKPGKPDDSLLIQAINYQGLEMPPDRKLGQREVEVLTQWVLSGAYWPQDVVPPGEVTHSSSEVTAEDRQHWSFRPLKRPIIPRTGAFSRMANPIDCFVAKRLQELGLRPAPLASPRTLIRRLYFDLIGLPPTPDEVERFAENPVADRYDRLVDQLLARPQYGERWGRHWLDLVRYAQTNGYERDDEKPHAWRFRDYVVRSFNEDKGFDRFVQEQLAGDELEGLSRETIIATGYYRLGVWDDEPDDKLVALWDEIDDLVRTTGETFLGLTIGCARCHEHKFDPIPQEDYYRLASFFRNVTPYGTDQSATHWKTNPLAVFTPLLPSSAGDRNGDAKKLKEVETLRKQRRMMLAEDANASVAELDQKIAALETKLQSGFDLALSVRESGAQSPPTHVLVRGSPLVKGDEVQPAFLTVLGGERPQVPLPSWVDHPLRDSLSKLGVKPTSGRRLALARWITSATNPLTSRVLANRLWHYHFGSGIVPTPSDFGRNGRPPSHPDLLDWLASELQACGWHLKHLHRQIVTSHAFRQSSQVEDVKAVRLDPGNRLLWRQNLRRLEAEAIRDAMLFVTGSLNLQVGGPAIYPQLSAEVLSTQSRPGSGWGKSAAADRSRRSIYIYVKRTLTVPLMDSFDQPNPDKPDPGRATTTIAPQALILLNSRFTDIQSTRMAGRLRRDAGADRRHQIEHAYRLTLGRNPTAAEQEISQAFLDRQRQGFRSLSGESELTAGKVALARFCRLLMNLNEFVYID
ncbi:MAG: PSD1 and planctomycete cytochrome C domain-containing protein [Planctomycetota bacterium]|nr:PSD1 and planctomycete cytochrome C domain-containing protein [Planctomycetota bacterium]